MGLAKQYDRDFEYFFWQVYPKRVGKPAAEKEFLRLKFTEDQMRELREHIEVRKRRDKKWLANKDGQTFVVDPERFLKHRRFEDEYETVSSRAPLPRRSYDVEPDEVIVPHNSDPEKARQHIRDTMAMLYRKPH